MLNTAASDAISKAACSPAAIAGCWQLLPPVVCLLPISIMNVQFSSNLQSEIIAEN